MKEINKPFLCKPTEKEYLWGGQRLHDDMEKGEEFSHLAESWECSTHPDGLSTVASGVFEGMKLSEVLRRHPAFLGSHVRGGINLKGRRNDKNPGSGDDIDENEGVETGTAGNAETAKYAEKTGQIPILVKFIDAEQDLSVQVHPSDAYAEKYENGQQGKTELWYVMDAAKNAHVVYGLKRNMDKEQMRKAMREGTLEKFLRKVPVKKNQVFFVEAGTIHAVGAGCLIAEIQENSNLTYRLYDYDRKDKNGRKRQLHMEKALDAADLTAGKELRQPMRVLRYTPGCARELLGRCRYFEVYRMLVNTERRQLVTYRADALSFRVLLCIDGCGTLTFEDDMLEIYRGDCIFVPADSVEIRIHGKLEFLDVRC